MKEIYLRYVFVFYAVYFAFILLLGLFADFICSYSVCELCILQRLWMIVLFIFSIISILLCGKKSGKYLLFLFGGMLFVGFSLSFWHEYLIVCNEISGVCSFKAGPSFLPYFLYDFLSKWYVFIPCESESVLFLGVSFPVWSIVFYGVAFSMYVVFAWVFLRGEKRILEMLGE